jgi:hypothetical protein
MAHKTTNTKQKYESDSNEEKGIEYWSSEILPNLFIGGENASLDKKRLKYSKITHILICAKELKKIHAGSFVYLLIPGLDTNDFKLNQYFEITNDFIKNGLKEGRLLICCMEGKSRSCTIAANYILKNFDTDLEETLTFLKLKHPPCNINVGFLKQLE